MTRRKGYTGPKGSYKGPGAMPASGRKKPAPSKGKAVRVDQSTVARFGLF